MYLIDQHTKRIMEGCKERAADAGLKFDKETLEYMVTNTDLLELSPKNMIPTLYDYWLQDIQVLRGKGEYEVYPNNPYETVINTRPVISFYNDNNSDWLNVMIFYHVLAHIDFFQSNKIFRKTWEYDFKEKALTEKRIIAKLRAQKGREVDYVIEFSKGIDNLVGFFDSLSNVEDNEAFLLPERLDYYFHHFLQTVKNMGMNSFLDEIEKYNNLLDTNKEDAEELFLAGVRDKYPEFDEYFVKYLKEKQNEKLDLLQFVTQESKFLNQENNKWMKTVIDIIRDTSLYFSPMIRTKTMNEGWASYWHEKLFMNDERIKGHEVAFAKINARVTSLTKIGLNPYAIGWRLFMHIEDMANKGKLSYDFQKILDAHKRENFNMKTDKGLSYIFYVRENYSDITFLNTYIDQEFVDKHKLMVVGQRIYPEMNKKEYYVKSRKAEDYKKMIIDSLYHPPHIRFKVEDQGELYLNHTFEGKELYREYISNTLIGLGYLWGNTVKLETTEYDWEAIKSKYGKSPLTGEINLDEIEPIYKKVLYTVKDKKVNKEILKAA